MSNFQTLPFVVCVLLWCSSVQCQTMPYKTYYFDQKVDHFSFNWKPYGQPSFKQRYLVQDKWWDQSNGGPIFFYTGNEGDITSFWENTGFMFDIAPQFKANVIFAEHRFYGKSIPFGTDKSFTHPYVDLLTIEQALADYATLIDHLKTSLNASTSPVICFGGSYGGMLAAYIRFKYPNIVDGSIAASAPIVLVAQESSRNDFFTDITRHFSDAVQGCGDKVREAFSKMQDMIASPQGLAAISKAFNLCKPLRSDKDYLQLVGWVRNSFAQLAMMDYPYPTNFLAPLPGWPVRESCRLLIGETDPVNGLYKLSNLFYGSQKCTDIWTEYVACADPTGCGIGPNSFAWDYQACTEVTMPAGTNNVTDFFPVLEFTLEQRADYCLKRWQVKPDNDWTRINLWGKQIKSATNVVFSNGDLDPWHRGGVLQDVSDSVLAVLIKDGAHHLDMRSHNPKDPPSVLKARQIEVAQIEKWIAAKFK